MTLDYTKTFLIVTEEAVVKGHFIGKGRLPIRAPVRLLSLRHWVPLGIVAFPPYGAFFYCFFEMSVLHQRFVVLSGVRSTESKNLRIIDTAQQNIRCEDPSTRCARSG